MKIIYTDAHLKHNPEFEIYDGVKTPYAEVSDRGEAIIKALREQYNGEIIAPQQFPLEHITALHHPAYVDFIQHRSEGLTDDGLLFPSYFMSDTYAPITPGTYAAALAAVDAALTGAQHLLDGEKQIYSLCRPPGHHAAHKTLGGYCYFNNAAIAAHYLSAHGKVAILDIDFHHGNGTQDIFYDRDDVLYVSIHADPAVMYPYSSGFENERGSGPGLDHTINYPLPLGTTDEQYVAALQKALVNVTDFTPDYLVVSAGFDTFAEDPIGGFALTVPIYKEIGTLIADLKMPSLIIQEGGYNVAHLGDMAVSLLSGF